MSSIAGVMSYYDRDAGVAGALRRFSGIGIEETGFICYTTINDAHGRHVSAVALDVRTYFR